MYSCSVLCCAGCSSRGPLSDRHRRHRNRHCRKHQHRHQPRRRADARVTQTWQTLVFEPFSRLLSRCSHDSHGQRPCRCLWSKRTPHTTQGTARLCTPALTACENENFRCFRRPLANDEERTLRPLLTYADRVRCLLACVLMLLVESRCPLDVNVVAVVRIRVVFVVGSGNYSRPPTFLPLNSKVSEG